MKLLIIDDNPEITDVVKYYCEGKNIECEIANSATEGLAAINNNKFNLILLDLAMPGLTGLDVINNLKMRHLLDSNNIVIFTASSDPSLFEDIKMAGVKEILKKPCGIDELGEVIERCNK